MSLEERAYRVDLIAEISAACVKVALEYGSDASAKARETESNAAFLERLKRIHTLCEELLVVSDDTIASYTAAHPEITGLRLLKFPGT